MERTEKKIITLKLKLPNPEGDEISVTLEIVNQNLTLNLGGTTTLSVSQTDSAAKEIADMFSMLNQDLNKFAYPHGKSRTIK